MKYLTDICGASGFAMAFSGLYLVSVPLSLVVSGIILMAFAYKAATK